MDDPSLADARAGALSNRNPGASDQGTDPEEAKTEQPENFLAESLKTLSGLTGGSLESAISEFLNGEGELHEQTRAALVRGGSSASGEVADLLEKQFNLSPSIAGLVAALLIKLVPSLKKTAKKKTPRKAKSPAKKKTSTTKKPKKKTTAAKKPVKKKTASKTAEKETSASAKPKKKTSASKPAAKKKPASATGKKKAANKATRG